MLNTKLRAEHEKLGASFTEFGGWEMPVRYGSDIDEHHTIEDVAITLGETFSKALGSKKGIERYGFLLPMDDCLAQVALDFGGRPWLVWEADFKREMIGEMPTEMFVHFFKSFSDETFDDEFTQTSLTINGNLSK